MNNRIKKILGIYFLAICFLLISLPSVAFGDDLASPVITVPVEGTGYDYGNIKATWDSVAGATNYTVSLKDQTTNSTEFSSRNSDSNGTGTTYTITPSYLTPAHSYTFTVTAIAGSMSTSSAVNFSVNDLPSPVITVPAAGASYDAVDLKTTWNSIPSATKYLVTLKDLTDNTTVINNQTVYSNSYTITSANLTPGHNYDLSVASVAGSVTKWSDVNFSINNVNLTAPVITNPVEGTTYLDANLTATWNSVPGALSYKLTLKDTTTNSILINSYNNGLRTSYTMYASSRFTNGHSYVFSVTAVAGSLSQSTDVNFSVKDPDLAGPVITSPVEGAGYDYGSIKATWDSVTGATNYTVSLKDQTTNSMAFSNRNSDSSGTGTTYNIGSSYLMPAHSYTLTVTATAGSTSTSSAVNFSVNDLPSPVIVAPTAGASYEAVDLKATWNSIPCATKYLVTLKDLTDNTTVINNQNVYSNSCTIDSGNLTPGHNYDLSVASVAGSVTKWSGVNFSINNVSITAPAVISPIEGTIYCADSMVVKWDSVTGATSYKVSLKDVTTNKLAIDGYENGLNTSYTIKASYLTDGHSYKLTVDAMAGSLTQSSEVNFTLKKQSLNEVASYTYDDLNRLSSVRFTNGSELDYVYDANGNLKSVSKKGY